MVAVIIMLKYKWRNNEKDTLRKDYRSEQRNRKKI